MSTNYAPIMQWKADESELYCVRFSRDETALFTLGSEDKVPFAAPGRAISEQRVSST